MRSADINLLDDPERRIPRLPQELLQQERRLQRSFTRRLERPAVQTSRHHHLDDPTHECRKHLPTHLRSRHELQPIARLFRVVADVFQHGSTERTSLVVLRETAVRRVSDRAKRVTQLDKLAEAVLHLVIWLPCSLQSSGAASIAGIA